MYIPRRCSSIVCVVTLGVHMALGMGWVVHIGTAKEYAACVPPLTLNSVDISTVSRRMCHLLAHLHHEPSSNDLFPLPSLRPPM